MSADMLALSLERKLACFQADCLLAASLIQTSLTHLPRDGTAHKGPGPSTPISNQ